MPKAPILDRTVFFEKLGDGTYRDLDWAVVRTSLGTMIEPRPLAGGLGRDNLPHIDLVDASFNRRVELREDEFYKIYNVSGRQFPVDF